MLAKIIDWSGKNRFIVLLATLFVVIGGVVAVISTPLAALPEGRFLDRELSWQGLRSRLLLQVHDELVLEVAAGERDQVESLVREQMGAAGAQLPDGPLDVPLDVSVGMGGSWHEAGH